MTRPACQGVSQQNINLPVNTPEKSVTSGQVAGA